LAEHIVGMLDRERALPEPLTAAEVNEAVAASLSASDAAFSANHDAQLATVRPPVVRWKPVGMACRLCETLRD